MPIARGFGNWFACESYSDSIRTSTKYELTHLRVLWRLRRTTVIRIHNLAFRPYLRSRSSSVNIWVLLGGILKNFRKTKMSTLRPNWGEIHFWSRIWASCNTLEVPNCFIEPQFFVLKKKSTFFLVDMPLRGGARSSQKVTILSQNSALFGPFSMWFDPFDAQWPRLMQYTQEDLSCVVNVRYLAQNVVFLLDFSLWRTRHTGFGLMHSENWSHFPDSWSVE